MSVVFDTDGIAASGAPFDDRIVAQPGRDAGEPAAGFVGAQPCGNDGGRFPPRTRERLVEREHGPEDRA